MNTFQIAEISGKKAHAGTKATEDVITIADKIGFKRLYLRLIRSIRNILQLFSITMKIL